MQPTRPLRLLFSEQAAMLPRVAHVPLRRQLREAVARAREEAKRRGATLTWQEIATRCGITSAGAMRKMLQGEAPIDDATAAKIAASIRHEVRLVIRTGRRVR